MNFSIRVTGDKHLNSAGPSYRHLGLVCQGGGQRGIFTAGVLDMFLKADFFPFSTLIGVSAGAQNLAAYACGANGYARRAIVRHTTHKAFYSPIRFARGGHLVDLDWYFESLNSDTLLDVERGQKRLEGRSFYLCASRRDTLEATYLPFHKDKLQQAIKASSAIPLLYRDSAMLDGVDYWDGAVADALPVRAAHDKGCDCIVVIRTTPREADGGAARLSRGLAYGRLKGMPALIERHITNYNEANRFIENPPPAVNVVEIAPRQPLKSRMLGSDLQALRHDYRLGLACGRMFLEHYAARLEGSTNTFPTTATA
ncbi:patatin-like phospholipase family protein [Chitinimonas sp.]|uniref:patatin-like phospholipase family protein n=1 Tax=Chitinimonas sp. TaxID=1934313 RepID=UPI002F95BCA1